MSMNSIEGVEGLVSVRQAIGGGRCWRRGFRALKCGGATMNGGH